MLEQVTQPWLRTRIKSSRKFEVFEENFPLENLDEGPIKTWIEYLEGMQNIYKRKKIRKFLEALYLTYYFESLVQ